MKQTLAIVTLSALVYGCAGPSPQYIRSTAGEAAPVAASAAEQTDPEQRTMVAAEAPSENQPPSSLSEEILFKYLAAEIADQRGQWQAAYINMLSVAQQARDPGAARRAAEIAMNAQQADAALAAVRLWQETAPESEEAAQSLVTLLLMNNRLEEARPLLLQRLHETAPQGRGTLILQVQRQLMRSSDKAAAFQILEEMTAPYQSLPETHLALAQAAFTMGNAARARQEAQAALIANPRSELAALVLAQVTTDKNEALKTLTSFLDRNPEAREVRLAYARMLVEQQQYKLAQEQFKLLLQTQPNDLTALYAAGLLAAQIRDYKEAEQYLTSFLDTLANSPGEERDPTQALLMLAQIAEERKDIPGALKWLSQIDPGNQDAHFEVQIRRAHLTASNGNSVEALKLLKKLQPEEEQQHIQLLSAQAQILKNSKQPKKALALLQNGLKRFPGNTDLLYDYAMTAETLKRYDTMEQALRRIIRLAPENQHAYNALGYSLADRKIRLREAHGLIRKAFELAPEDPFIMDSMGWVEYRLGRLDEAERLLRKAYERQQDPEIAVHLGEVLWVQGKQEDARKLWRAAASQDPKNNTLNKTLARLHVDL